MSTEKQNYEELYDDGDYVDCWNCGGEGFSGHDCGEDTCCCLDPEDDVVCDICKGEGGWKNDMQPPDTMVK